VLVTQTVISRDQGQVYKAESSHSLSFFLPFFLNLVPSMYRSLSFGASLVKILLNTSTMQSTPPEDVPEELPKSPVTYTIPPDAPPGYFTTLDCLNRGCGVQLTLDDPPLQETVREIDDDSWLVGDRILVSRRHSPSPDDMWNDGEGSYYVVSEAPDPTTAMPTTIGHESRQGTQCR
jgi:hypothetical protein